LAWIYISLDGNKAKFATTDSFRMTEYKVTTEKDFWINFAQIIPNKTAFELRSILDDGKDVKIVVWENQVMFLFENTKFYSRLLNGKFPDYEWFFPTTHSTKSVLNRIDLIQALKKINLLSKENNYSIKVSFSNESGILIESSETQIWEWKISLVWTVEWDDNIIWLNSEYFLECLWVIDTTHVSISFESPLSPILILPINDEVNKKDNWSFRHIIMPLKI
jgi:DNA polymerase-3 subunit beta